MCLYTETSEIQNSFLCNYYLYVNFKSQFINSSKNFLIFAFCFTTTAVTVSKGYRLYYKFSFNRKKEILEKKNYLG